MRIPTKADATQAWRWFTHSFDTLLPAFNTFRDSVSLWRPTTFEGDKPNFTRVEETKFSKIKILISDICKKLGIFTPIHLHISENPQPCLGTISSFGGPIISLQQSHFAKYGTDDLAYREWLTILDALPNNSAELTKYLNSCDKPTLKKIQTLAQKYRETLSQDELEFVLARDLCSAKNYNLVRSQAVDAIALYAGKCAADALVQSTKLDGWKEKLLQVVCQIACVAIPNYLMSNYHANQATLECASPTKFQKGALQFYKKAVLLENREDSAKTLDQITKLPKDTSSQSAMSWKMNTITGLACVVLFSNYVFQARSVYNLFNSTV